jgi:serine/threonine protein kinase
MMGKVVPHYKILQRLGEGSFGVEYKAENTRLHRMFALIFLPTAHITSDEDRRCFMHEARTSAVLSSPNIATVIEIDGCGSEPLTELEFIERQSLAEQVRGGPLNSPARSRAQRSWACQLDLSSQCDQAQDFLFS